MTAVTGESFPRQYARTQRFTLGEPRDVVVSPDDQRVVFARSRGGSDPVNCLWVADVATGGERLVADPLSLLGIEDPHGGDLPPAERARRERAREAASGVTTYATDAAVTVATFALNGRLFLAGLLSHSARELVVPGPVFDPQPDPTARRIAYVSGRRLRIAELDGTSHDLAAEPNDPEHVTWGSAEFIAAEEMGRSRGYWWSPDGESVAACRVDTSAVPVWHIGDPADPLAPPTAVRYPAAGTPNAVVTLHLLAVDGSKPIEVVWDRSRLPYLAHVAWTSGGLAITVQSRDQRDLEVLVVDEETGSTQQLFVDHDDDWVELVPGAGELLPDGRLITCADRDGTRRLVVAGDIASPHDVQVRSILAVDDTRIHVCGNPVGDATVQHVYRWSPAMFERLTDGDGIHTAVVGGDAVVVRSATLEPGGPRWRLPGGPELVSHADTPTVEPVVHLRPHRDRTPATAVLLPHARDGSPLPVLLDPYGGPHAQRVVCNRQMFLTSQWFADQGFAVVVADGRGTPGRGSAFERAVRDDLAVGVLDDQIAALHAAAEQHPEIDLARVAIRGWSFGGYLAALAVMRRPDVFHAAVAGAPVTEWRLYDTHYTERYLGDPGLQPDVYDANSLLPLAAELTRPLLLIHGLADDNVVAAHTLQLSSALLAAGKPHEVLPLVGVTHMTPQETIAENLLLHQLDFLRRALGLSGRSP